MNRSLSYQGAKALYDNYSCNVTGKYIPNMNKFCDWLSETKVIMSVHDLFFGRRFL